MLARRRFLFLPRFAMQLPNFKKHNLGEVLKNIIRMMKTAYTFVSSPNHIYPDHPERPGRLDLLEPRLQSFDAEPMEARTATREEIAYVHNPNLVSALEKACREQAPGIIDYAPTYITQSSFDDALLAAGGVITCSRAVLNGEANNAFAIVRPPGHHAEPDRAMGFCIFNNVAVAARDALTNRIERVAIIDYDAHHGNGTQAVFLNDERVAFLSAHQYGPGFYPGTGGIEDAPQAKRRIVNVPLPARAGDQVYEQVADRIFVPFLESFKPQMLFVSVGFDAHWNDPITMLGLSTAGYLMLARKMMALAEEYCEGRIVFVLEGGYDPTNVANGAEAVFIAATGKGESKVNDANPHKEPDCESRIEEIRKRHGFEAS
jgi:acetoin utilization deacetylase AcuC-like enzyme